MLKNERDGNTVEEVTDKNHVGKEAYPDASSDNLNDEAKDAKSEAGAQETAASSRVGKAKTKEQAIKDSLSLIPEPNRKHATIHFDNRLSLDTINEFNAAVEDIQAKYPSDGLYGLGSREESDNSVLATFHYGQISLNHDDGKYGIFSAKSLRPYSKAYKEQHKNGFSRYNVGTTQNGLSVKAAVIHEYGHLLSEKAIKAAENFKYCKKFNLKFDESKRGAMESWNAFEREYKKHRNGFIKSVSEYAHTNAIEGFAECFCYREYEGGKLPEKLEKALDNVIKTGIVKRK